MLLFEHSCCKLHSFSIIKSAFFFIRCESSKFVLQKNSHQQSELEILLHAPDFVPDQ